jgi:parallel beta-helix repeat protein
LDKLRSRHHRATVALGAVIFALAGAALLALGRGSQALASHVNCGDKITRDTRLDSDLVNCRNNGIVIGADGVTLNLNGHTIDGDGAPAAGCNPRKKFCDTGVVSAGHDGVTVRGGSVREFHFAVLAGDARRIRLLGITSSENRGLGILIFNSARSLVRDSSILRNGLGTHSPGLVLFRSHHNLIERNAFSRTGDAGLVLDQSDRNQIRQNRLRGNPQGGIAVAGDGNVIARNRVSRSGAGILITLLEDSGRAVGNVVRRNHVRGARAAGISVDPGPGIARTLLARNHVFGAGGAGIHVLDPGTTLTRNEARRNGGLGIFAVRGVIDGGGNRASGNGDRRQCVNVACR